MASLCSLAPFSGLQKKHKCCFPTLYSSSAYLAHPSSVKNAAGPIAVGIFVKDVENHRKRGRNCKCVVASVAKEKDEYVGKEDTEELSEATLLWRAIKLPIYTVALVPLTVASAASYFQTGLLSASLYFRLLASSICIITWLNLSNDVYDFDTGADKNKKESVVNMLQSRTGTLVVAYVLLALGLLGLISVAAEAGNVRSILLLMSAITCGYTYQCPPFRLSYQGLGEPLCFAAFGPFATTAFYLIQANHLQHFSSTILALSILVGCTTTLILFCSHFHQVEGDLAVGKFSPLVRIGTETGAEVVQVAVIALYSLVILLGVGRVLPLASTVFCALTMPTGIMIINYVKQNHHDNAKIFIAKYLCVRLHTLFGLALSLGLVAARKFSQVPLGG